ncbi:MAG: YDG domain-containing protein [Sulfuritalea sp.]|nr:YDG domain-containing protein [Sulfuritalea sp.]
MINPVSGVLDIWQKELTVGGNFTVANKVYDGTTAATITSNGLTLSGLVGTDSVTPNWIADFWGSTVGNTKWVVLNNSTIGGPSGGNYFFIQSNLPLTQADITRAPLTVTANAASKTYDGLAYNGGNGVAYTGLVNGQTSAVLGGTLAYAGTSQGAKKAGNYVITPSGLTSSNYTIGYADGALTVDRAPLTVSGNFTAANKTYDGTTAATIASSTLGFSGRLGADLVTPNWAAAFSDQNAGNGKTVDLSATTLSGASSGNYTVNLASAPSTTANIAPAPLTVSGSFTAASKVYDGTSAATITSNNLSLSGVIRGESVSSVTPNWVAAFVAPSAGGPLTTVSQRGNNFPVALVGTTFGGASGGNYFISPETAPMAHADITPAPLTITANAASKTYNGLAWSGNNGVSYTGLVNGETPTTAVLTGTLAYGGNSQGAVNAGSYAITPSSLTAVHSNYTISYVNGVLTVNTAPLTVTANAAAKTYDGLGYSGGNGVGYSGFVNGETTAVLGGTLVYGGTSQGATNAGNYLITPSGLTSGNYAISYADSALTVNKAALTVTGSFTAANKSYDGTSTTAIASNALSVTGGLAGADSVTPNWIAAFNDQNAGNGKTVNLSATTFGGPSVGNYTISLAGAPTTTANISPAPLTVTANAASKTYNGLAYSGGNGVGYSGLVNGETSAVLGGALAYGGSSQGAKNAGSYTITPSGLTSGNYTLSFNNGSLTISKANATITASSGTSTYNGQQQSVSGFAATGLVNGETGSILTGITTSGGSGTNAGSYATIASGTDGNYNLSFVNGSLVITPAALTVTANNVGKTYDGLTYSGGNGVSYSGLVGGDTSSALGGALAYGGSSQGAKNTGSYLITPSGLTSGNYTISFNNGSLTISKANATVTASSGTSVYSGQSQSISGFSASGLVNGETAGVLTGVSSGGSGTNAGTYATVASGTDGNYNLSFVNGSLAITPAPLTVTANAASKTYDGLAYSGGNGVGYSGFANNETGAVLGGSLSYGGGSQGAKNAGSYAITPSGLTSGNYTITFNNGSLTVTPAPLTVSTGDVIKTYDGTTGAAGLATVSGGALYGTDSLNGGSFAFTDKNAGIGNKSVTVSGVTVNDGNGGNNYTVSYASNTSSTINKAPLTISANGDARVYDGNAYSGGNGVSYSSFVSGENSSVLGGGPVYGGTAQGAVNAGAYAITPSGITSGNYAITFADGALTISPAGLTLLGVGADNKTKIYGNDDPALTWQLASGALVPGDSITGNLTRDTGENAGDYAIRQGSLTGGSNYVISFANGMLTITPRNLTVSTANVTKTYDGTTAANGSVITTAGSLVGSDSLSGGAFVFAGPGAGSNKTVTVSGVTVNDGNHGANYALTYAANTASTITTAPLTVTANAASKNYDGLAWASGNGVGYSGFVNGETSAVLGGALAYGGSSQGAKNAGSYTITPSGLTSGNYTISFNNGSLTISKANATVTANSGTSVYSGQSQGISGFTATGLVNGETGNILTGVTAGGSGTNAGNYATIVGGTDGNYNLSFVNGSLTISKANATVTANSGTSTYNGQQQSISGFSTTGLVNGETGNVLTGITTGGGSGTNAGSYATIASGTDGNYNLSFVNGSLTISKANATVTANSGTSTYNSQQQSISGFSATGLVSGETGNVLTGVTAGGSGTNAGSYATIASGTDGNYNLSFVNGALTVNKAPLSVTGSFTAANKTYDGTIAAAIANNALTISGGLVGTDSVTANWNAAFSDPNAGNGKTVNLAATTFGGTASGNYTINLAGAPTTTANISSAALTVTANAASKAYNGLTYSGGNGVSYSGLVNGETSAVLGGALAFGGTSQGAINAGSYAIAPSGLTSGNYTIGYADGALTVNTAPLTVTANAAAKTYDGLAYSGGNGVNYSGFVNGETNAVLGGSLGYGGTSQGAINAGSYLIAPSGLTSANYSIGYADGALTVNTAPLTVTANAAAKTYDGLAFSGGNGVGYNGFVNGETSAVLGGSLGYGGTSQGAVNTGNYAITPSGLTSGNYSIGYADGALTIAASPTASPGYLAAVTRTIAPDAPVATAVLPNSSLALSIVDGGIRLPEGLRAAQ